MPEISLKAYFAKLNNLLGVSSADEVIQHSRHILQSYPKNVTAYRFLGRALVLSGRWDEGREALRRVLSVYPDDYIAHLGLSEANEHLDHPDEAIWHLERAYEQNSNNRDVIEALRNLYRRYRNIDNLKMQLTSAAVARQNLRSKDYAQAIDTLRSARARMNDRLDLKLLLAQVLWEHGSEEEAAEIAVEVLKVLPDCLEANRIMARLWLSMGRPSDAQRYVNHLEAVDPYLAVEVAQGFPPDDDVFRLDELDYVRTSQSELASARPDWLTEIGTNPMPVVENEGEQRRDDWSSLLLGSKSPAESVTEPGPLSRFTEITPQPEPKQTSGLTDLFGDPLAAPGEELKSLFERATGSLDDDLPSEENLLRRATSRFEPEPENTGGLTDLFGNALDAPGDELASLFENATGTFGDANDSNGNDDRLAWMRDAGIEMVNPDEQQPSYRSLMAEAEDGELPVFDDSPMAWLEDHNSDLIVESNSVEQGSANPDDIYSWMQEENDFVDSLASGEAQTNTASTAAPVEANDESFDWLQNDHLLDEALSVEGHSSSSFNAPDDQDFAAFSATGTDWQSDMPDQQQSATAETTESAAPGARRGLTAILQSGNFDWINQEKPEEAVGAETEMEDWLNQFGPVQPRTAPTDTPDWLTNLGISGSDNTSSEDDEWFKQDEPERLSPAALANAQQFARMSENEANNADEEEGDWLSALPSEEDASDKEASEEEAFEWVGGEAPATVEADVDTGALPDWLTDYVPAEAQADIPTPAAETTWTADATVMQPEADSALTDWLSELEPEDEDAAETPASDSEINWTEDAGLDDDEVAAEETDWLAELQPAETPTGANEATSSGDASWLAELDTASSGEPQAAAETVPSEDMSWLSELEPASSEAPEAEPETAADAQAEPAASEDMSWLADLGVGAETLVGDLPAEPIISEDMSWLSELEPASSDSLDEAAETVASEAPAVNIEDFPWMSDEAEAADVEQPVAEVDAVLTPSEDADWLSEFEPETEQPPAIKLEPAASSDLEWLSELDAATETPAVSAEDFPWMAEEGQGTTAEQPVAEAGAEPVAEEDMDWLAELEPDAEAAEPTLAAAVAEEDTDWLAELEPDAEVAEPTPAAAVAEEDMDWLAELEPDADTGVAEQPVAAAVTDEDMSWLSELEPTPEPKKEAAEEVAVAIAAAVTSEEDDWLNADDSSEEDEGVAAEMPAADIPDWLSELEPASSDASETEPEAEPEPAADAASEEADESGEDEEEAVAAEMPDWLTDLEPTPEPEQAAAAEVGTEVAAVAAALNGADEEDAFAASVETSFTEDEEMLEPTPAQNAPDWLNAMVPGLDVDYEASEDEADDVDEESYDADEREYAWVDEIVEQEMAAVEGSGYTFTRPPAWFASLNTQQGSTEDDFPDWVADDSDLPDYLR